MIIYKYNLDPDVTSLSMPEGAILLSAGCQLKGEFNLDLVLWALVDPAMNPITRVFRVVSTGQDIAYSVEKLSYIKTIQQLGVPYVWHVFEILK